MFINFFFDLKQASLPVSLKEYLMLMEAMNKRVVDSFNVNDFYYLSRSALVKDERYLDKFDIKFIQVLPIPNIGIGKALNDRLIRASFNE